MAGEEQVVEEDAVTVVEAERARLLRLAYRMLGSWTDAEDIVQHTFERWYRQGEAHRAGIESPAAWLTTTASRLCLTFLDSARVRRERYAGPWLPEPLPAHLAAGPGPLEQVTAEEAVSTALLVVLEALTPAQRVAYVLHEVFGLPYPEIAGILGRTPEATRQLASAARRAIRRQRSQPADPGEHARLVTAFREACRRGDLEALITVLAPDAVSTSDGGGMRGVARRPVVGADRVARFLLGSLAKWQPQVGIETTTVNDRPGLVAVHRAAPGQVIGVVALDTGAGRIRSLWITMNPDKLRPWNGLITAGRG